MSFREWWQWRRSLPLSLQWFVWLMLFRPLIDTLYFVKGVSPFLSPLYIIAVLTPVVIVASYCSRTFPSATLAAGDMLMAIWSTLLVFNVIAGFTYGLSVNMFEMALRLTQPIFLYFFLRHFVQSKHHLLGVLTTFLYSTSVAFAMLLYERLVSPLQQAILTRGFERTEGLFADVNSYAAYVAGGLLIAGYLFIDEESGAVFKTRALRLAAVGGLSLMALLSMHHAASWAVMGALTALLVLHSASARLPAAVLLIALCLPAYFLLGDAIGERLDSMFANEVAVLEGDRQVQYAFHGRMTRWQRHLDEWQAMPVTAKLFGVAMYTEPMPGKVLGGIHNDYLRILFASGWFGLFAYLGFYGLVFLRTLRLPVSEAFLIRGSMAIMLMYSITGGVTTSIPMLSLGMCVLAYGASPRDASHVSPVRSATPAAINTGLRPGVSVAPLRRLVSRR